MVKWTVRAIQVGSIELDRSAMTHFKGKGERITVPIWCAGATDGTHKVALEVAVRLLQGKEIDEANLVANPMDENLINTIMVAPPYVVTKEAQPDATWMEGLENTEAISLDEAMELLKDSADTAALDGYMSDEAVDKLFK